MGDITTILQQFSRLSGSAVNNAVKDWKARGGKTIGLFCSYVPEELIYAAGLLPVRMRAINSADTSIGDSYTGDFTCSFVRHCLGMAFSGGYDFLDGIVCFNSCDHVRRIYDIWNRKLNTPFQHYLSVPHKGGKENVDFYRDELILLKRSLEHHFNVTISDEDLRQAIKVCNETRNLQRQLYELRKMDSPPIRGAETLSIIVAGTAMPKDLYNELLKELLRAISGQEGYSGYNARLMIVGSMLDDPEYLRVFEELGGMVVTDLMCFGTGILWESVDETVHDPLEALARYHLDERVPCARMVGRYASRVDFILDMVKKFKVDGIVCEQIKFCDMWAAENLLLKRTLRESGVPVLVLEREYLMSGLGQLKTRAQAFLETILEAKNVKS